jgi:hypothetical protein
MNESCSTIQELFEHYKSDLYMTSRMQQYICNRLPKIFETFSKNHKSNQTYEVHMQNNQETFIQNFLNMNKYFYVPTSEKFFVYENEHYSAISEDNILHNVLTSISKNRALLSWKKSTKINIMCKIKNNLFIKSIPNSETIQYVLDLLYPAFFSTKSEAKYFLTIIGDAIFKKNSQLFHFIISKAKHFLQELNNYSQTYIGTNILTTFKHKYYDHEYANCRLIRISENIKNEQLWRTNLNNHFLDILCVASHYSIRYNSSDEYILSINDSVLIDYTFFLKNKTQNTVVDIFTDEYIKVSNIDNVQSGSGSQIPWKNMLYLWRHFLNKNNLPFVIFQQNLKQIITKKFASLYNESTDSFFGICSKYMPSIQTFLQFWNESMIHCDAEYDLEIEEIMILFKRWTNTHTIVLNNMNEAQIVDLIIYYFPDTEIEDGKYIHKIMSRDWNKKDEIRDSLDQMRSELIDSKNDSANISFYELYEYYCKKQRSTNALIVSKQYFEKYILENLSEYVMNDAFIIGEWIFT